MGSPSTDGKEDRKLGLYAHATHVYITGPDMGRMIAGALLKSPHSLVISRPYDKWLNVYLPMGLSYKDVPELPTAAAIEVNVYDGQGLDLRLYAQDRLQMMFESGCSDVGEEEDQLLEIAEKIWTRENPDLASAAAKRPSAADAESEDASGRQTGFWGLPEGEQEKYLSRARSSGEFSKFAVSSQIEEIDVDVSPAVPYLPEGRTQKELSTLLRVVGGRLFGSPMDNQGKESITKWMGKLHSEDAADYAAAISKFLGLRGSLWSLETIQEQKAGEISRRVVPIESLDGRPAGN